MVSTTNEAGEDQAQAEGVGKAKGPAVCAHALHVQKQIMEGALRALAIGLRSLPVAHGRFADVARRLLEVFEEFLNGRLSVRQHGVKP